jgi:superfamily II DNA or RNA helicase
LTNTSLLTTDKTIYLNLFGSYLRFSSLNDQKGSTVVENQPPSPQITKFLLDQLAKVPKLGPESDKGFEAKRQLFLEHKNTVYQNYNESLKELENDGRKLNNTEKYSLFINKFFEDIEGLSALLPNRYNLNRKTSRMFLNHFIQSFSKDEKKLSRTASHHAEIIESFVGSGKTFLIGMMLAALPDGLTALISTPGKDLQRQLLNTILRFAPDKNISQISSNNYKAEPASVKYADGQVEEHQIPYGLEGDIVFAVNDSLAKLQKNEPNIVPPEALNKFNPAIIILDEVHTITSPSEQNKNIQKLIVDLMKKGGSFIGFSATPNNLTAQPQSADDIMLPVGKAALFTNLKRSAANFLNHPNIKIKTDFQRSLEDGIRDNEIPTLCWHKLDINSQLKKANPDFDLLENLTAKDLKDDGTDIKRQSLENLLNREINTSDKKNSWDIICDSIAQKIKGDTTLKNLRGFSFTPNIDKSQILAKTLTENGIPAASYSSKGIFISTEIFNSVQNPQEENDLDKILNGKKFQGNADDSEFDDYKLIPLNDTNRNHNKELLFTLLKNKKLLNISSVSMLGTGTDLPWLELAVMATPTNSHTKYVQDLGRVTRLDPENLAKTAHVLDVVIEGNTVFQPFNLALATGHEFSDGETLSSQEKTKKSKQGKTTNTVEKNQELRIPASHPNFYSRTQVATKIYKKIPLNLMRSIRESFSPDYIQEKLNAKTIEFLDNAENKAFSQEDLIKVNEQGEDVYNPLIWFQTVKDISNEVAERVQEIQANSNLQEEETTSNKQGSASNKVNINTLIESLAQETLIDRRYIIKAVTEIEKENNLQYKKGRLVDPWSEEKIAIIIKDAEKIKADEDKNIHRITSPEEREAYKAYKLVVEPRSNGSNEIPSIKNIFVKALSPAGKLTEEAIPKEEWKKTLESGAIDLIKLNPASFVSLEDVIKKTHKTLYPNQEISAPNGEAFSSNTNNDYINIQSLIKELINKKDFKLYHPEGKPVELLPLTYAGKINIHSYSHKGNKRLEHAEGLTKTEFETYMKKISKLANNKDVIFPGKELKLKSGGIAIMDSDLYKDFEAWMNQAYPQETGIQILDQNFKIIKGLPKFITGNDQAKVNSLVEFLRLNETPVNINIPKEDFNTEDFRNKLNEFTQRCRLKQQKLSDHIVLGKNEQGEEFYRIKSLKAKVFFNIK